MGADRIRGELEDQPRIQANLMTAIGRVYMGLGLPDQARPLLEEGLAVRRDAFPPGHTEIADSLQALGMLNLINGDYATAVELQRESLSMYEEALGEDAIDLAWMLSTHAVTLGYTRQTTEALAVQQRALDLLREDPDNNLFYLGQALNNLGFVQNSLSMQTEAMQTFEEAVEVLARTEARGLYSRSLANLGSAYMLTGRLAESKELYEEAIRIQRDWFGPEHFELGYPVNNLSFVYQELGDYAMAESLKKEAIGIFSKQLGPNHPNIGIITIGLAKVLNFQGKYGEADEVYRRALDNVRNGFGPESIRVSIVHNGIGENLADQGRFSEAEASYREAIRIGTGVNPEHSEVADSHGRLARLSESTLTVEEREAHFRTAIDLLQQNEGAGSLRAAFFQTDFAILLAHEGREQEARAQFDEGLSTLSSALGEDNPRYMALRDKYESLFGAR